MIFQCGGGLVDVLLEQYEYIPASVLLKGLNPKAPPPKPKSAKKRPNFFLKKKRHNFGLKRHIFKSV